MIALTQADRDALAWQLGNTETPDEYVARVEAHFGERAEQIISDKVAKCKARRAVAKDKRPRAEREAADKAAIDALPKPVDRLGALVGLLIEAKVITQEQWYAVVK